MIKLNKCSTKLTRIKSIATIVLLMVSFCSASNEKIVNGEFNSGLSNWQINNWSGGVGNIIGAVDLTGKISGTNSARITINPSANQWWELNFRQLFSVVQNRCYEISFYAMADRICTIQLLLQNSESPYETFVYPVITVGTTPLKFTTSGTANFTGNGQIMFALGKTEAGATIWFDNISVIEQTPPVGIPSITVNFAQTEQVNNMSGFLLGLDPSSPPTSAPAQIYMDVLKPAFWRVRPTTDWVDRVDLAGSTAICLLSEGWYPGDPLTNPTTPWSDNYAAWEAHVRSKAQTFGTTVVYDIWNEPDHKTFFMNWPDATFEKFLEKFKHAHDVIRSELGTTALISGPSLSESISPVRHRQFLDYCKDNGLVVQILSLHMLDRDDSRLGLMTSDIQSLRSAYLDNPAYAFVGMQFIHVNEYGGWGLQSYRPGSLLAFLGSLERADVDGACKSCWPHPNCASCSTCWDGSLDGVMTQNGVAPRAAWWVYKWYTDSVSGRVSAESSNYGVFPVAGISSDMPDTAQVIIGSNGWWGEPGQYSSVNITLNNINQIPFIDAAVSKIAVHVETLPYSDVTVADALNSPQLSEQFVVDVVNGVAQFTIGNLSPYQVKRILIRDSRGLSILLQGISENWLNSCSVPLWCDNYDVNYSSKVDLKDFACFAAMWLDN